ncbi:MAG: discoidin domain-containing protein, partial [Armatimonadetes bacterium]|nr:discoidin domain-containing protein [Armatimonadota bacterium]
MSTCLSGLLACALAAAVQPAGVRWTVIDLSDGRSYSQSHAPTVLDMGGQEQLSAPPCGVSLRVHYEAKKDFTLVTATLAGSEQTGERGFTVRMDVLLPAGKTWQWWDDVDTSQPLGDRLLARLAALRELPGLPEFEGGETPSVGQYSVYPLGVVSAADQWLAVARPMHELIIARFSAVGAPQPTLRTEVDMALSAHSRNPREATFHIAVIRGEGAGAGMRAALTRMYQIWPEDWQVRTRVFGGWMPFTDLAEIPNVDEFGFAFQEGAASPAFVDKLGALSFVYFHCAGEFTNVEGYKRGTEPLPPYEKVVAAFNEVAKRRTGLDGVWDLCGIRGPDGRIAYRPEKVYGDFFCQACVDPDLPYGRIIADELVGRVTRDKFPEGIDGVYYDGIAAGLDYAENHLQVANHPLLWDPQRKRAVNYNLFSSVEWASYVYQKLAGTDKLTMENDSSLSSFAFSIPYIDVPGAEMSINLQRSQARLIRAYTWRKPFCTLVKADFTQYTSAHIETYMRRCTAYGILFGFFDISPSGAHPGSSYWLHPEWYDRDRALFRRYMPVARELAQAGWQPLTGALVSGDGAFVERFGPGANGVSYLTVSTDPGTDPTAVRPITVSLDSQVLKLPKDAIALELLTGRIEHAAGQLQMTLAGDDLAVWAIGSPSAQARACIARAMDVLGRRRRYVQACRDRELTLAPWSPVGDGASIDTPGRGGAGQCLKVTATREGQYVGATQQVALNHDRPRPIVVSGWSRAKGVTGEPDKDYSIYVDVYYTDGSALYGNTFNFACGTHDWQFGEVRIEPQKPIRVVNVYLLMRGKHTGTAWFDDIHVALADEPGKNLVRRGDFEAGANRPLASDTPHAREISARFEELEAVLASAEPDYARADRLLAEIERVAREANWGADTERTLRDVDDVRWHLRLARACAAGRAQPAQRPSRITEHVALAMPQPAQAQAGVSEYVAQSGRVPAGTRVKVDSLFSEYTARPLTDGKINPTGVHWTEVAWASAEEQRPHWVELTFPQPVELEEVRIWWAADAGRTWVSRKVILQRNTGNEWTAIDGQQVVTDRERGSTVIRVPGRSALK